MFGEKKQLMQVGLFVFIGLFLFSTTILLLGGDKMFFSQYDQFKLRFNHVQGISVGSVVSISGINVGNVKQINLISATGDVEIVVDIDNSYSKYITVSSKASVRTQGALGDKFVYIEPGDLSAKALNPGETIASTADGDIMDMIIKKGGELTQVVDAVNELKKIFEQLNAEGRVSSIAKHLDELLIQSNLLVTDFRGKKGEANLRNSMAHLESILKKVDNSQGSLGSLINDPTLHNKIVEIFGGAPRKTYLKPLIRATINSQERK